MRPAVRRLLTAIPLLFASTLLVFFLLRLMPGDAALSILADTPHTREMREALREELGLNDGPLVQYSRWLISMVSGGFGGASLATGEAIQVLLRQEAPVTLLLALYVFVFSNVIAVPTGLIAANAGRWKSVANVGGAVALTGISLPNVLVASSLLLLLVRVFGWFPPIFYSSPGENLMEHLTLMIWPVIILSWEYGGHIFRAVRSGAGQILESEYIRAARGRGISNLSLLFRHSLKAITGPVVNVAGAQFGVLLGGTVVLESLFGIPGMGRGLIRAAASRDFTVIMSYSALFITMYILLNLLTDLSHEFSDPRLHSGKVR